MKSIVSLICVLLLIQFSNGQSVNEELSNRVQTNNGMLSGESVSGIRTFLGIPYAQPPVGNLRWKEPQAVKNWEGIRKANHFGPRAMQLPIYSDMQFRSDGVSEDCLYLNIWTSAKSMTDSLPVLVYFYGGGMKAGDGSEYRYDGESMSRKGIISITVNYRLGVFGFLALPELSKESPHHASGNYGLMDQTEALRWVKTNIAAFGGNPNNITIDGESAGSFSVCAQMITPLSKNLFTGAIGESGAVLDFETLPTLATAEKTGMQFVQSLGNGSLADLRAMPADQVLTATVKARIEDFPMDVDGYFFPESPLDIYKSGRVSRVPLLVGWNAQEQDWHAILGEMAPTKTNYINAVKKMYPAAADQILKVYAVNTDADVQDVATDLASDRFIVFGTWRWAEMQSKLNATVYRYIFTKPRPGSTGAVHSAEIEYALGNLSSNRVYSWEPDDYRVSAVMQTYFLNFIKTRNPNGLGVPYWPVYQSWQKDPVMYIGAESHRGPDKGRDRFLLLEKLSDKTN